MRTKDKVDSAETIIFGELEYWSQRAIEIGKAPRLREWLTVKQDALTIRQCREG